MKYVEGHHRGRKAITKKKTFEGTVYGFKNQDVTQTGDSHIKVWTFRLIPEDRDGNLHLENQIAVQMEGQGFEGSINEGDKVRMEGKWNEGEVVHPDYVLNLTTRSRVFESKSSNKKKIAGYAIGGVVLVIVLVLILQSYYDFQYHYHLAQQQQQLVQEQIQRQTQEMQQQVQPMQSQPAAIPTIVVFSGSTTATYANMANYQRIVVIGNNAYWMGVKSDNFVALSNLPLVSEEGDQNAYAAQHDLNLISNYDSAISKLSTLTQDPDCPVVSSMTSIQPNPQQTITINGRGFGSQQPFVGDSQYILIADYTATPYWSAGHTGDLVTLNVSKWTDSQIVISGFVGSYGSQKWVLKTGDTVDIYVANPNESCRIPGFFDTLVGS